MLRGDWTNIDDDWGLRAPQQQKFFRAPIWTNIQKHGCSGDRPGLTGIARWERGEKSAAETPPAIGSGTTGRQRSPQAQQALSVGSGLAMPSG